MNLLIVGLLNVVSLRHHAHGGHAGGRARAERQQLDALRTAVGALDAGRQAGRVARRQEHHRERSVRMLVRRTALVAVVTACRRPFRISSIRHICNHTRVD